MKNIIIKYYSMEFIFEIGDDIDAWYSLDFHTSVCKKHVMKIDANQEVYAKIIYKDKEIFGKITDKDNNHPADNFPIENGEIYYFHRMKKSIYE